jgi:response regulator NasT
MNQWMRPLRIAIADDERDTREFFQELLPRLGHQVAASAETGRQLADQCQATAPDLVITDIKMPDMDGIQAAEEVNRSHQVPVILVSAHHDAELIVRAGVDHIMAYLIKPVKQGDLETAIYLAMMRFDHFQKLIQEAADLRQALEDRKLIERAKGIIMKRARLDEPEAFRRLQKLACDRNQKIVECARIVLAAEEAFQPPPAGTPPPKKPEPHPRPAESQTRAPGPVGPHARRNG